MKRNMMVGLAIFISLCLVGIFFLPVLLDLNRYRDRYLPVLEQVLHRPVDIQDVRLTIFPRLGVRLQGITIADDPALSPTPFVTIPSADVVVQWVPLLSRRIQVERIVIQNPTARVIRGQNGVWNTSTIGKDPSLQPSGKGASGAEGSLDPILGVLAVEQFSMTGGILRYEDRSQDQWRSYQLDHLAVVTDAVQIGQTATIQVTGRVMPYELPLDMSGTVGPLRTALDVPIIDLVGRIGNVEANAKGKVMHGKLELDVQIPHVSPDDLRMDAVMDKPIALNHIQAHLVAPLLPPEGLKPVSGVSIDPLAFDLLLGTSIIHFSGKGTPARLTLIGKSPAVFSQDVPLLFASQHPFLLEQLQLKTIIKGARIELEAFNATAFEGDLEAHGQWDGTFPAPVVSLSGHFKHFAVEPLIRTVQSSSVSLTGTGELHWNISGSLPPSATPHLDGSIRLRIRKGNLIGLDLVQTMEDALQLPGLLDNSSTSGQFSVIDANADLEEKGLVLRHLTLDASDFSIKGVGNIGFDQTLQLRGDLAISPVISDRIIHQFPMTKAVRQQGKLVLPFKVHGSLQKPVLQLDTTSLGNQVKKNLEKRLKKVLQGDEQELRQLLQDGEDILKQLFGK